MQRTEGLRFFFFVDFLISSIGKVQKGQRLALGLDDDVVVNEEPEINIIEGLCEGKI